MLGLLIASVIIGGIIAAISGVGLLFWIVAGIVFFGGLPVALAGSFIHNEVGYMADRADARQRESDAKAELRGLLADTKPTTVHDNRQIHFHGGGE
jgi:hypothetical protein